MHGVDEVAVKRIKANSPSGEGVGGCGKKEERKSTPWAWVEGPGPAGFWAVDAVAANVPCCSSLLRCKDHGVDA